MVYIMHSRATAATTVEKSFIIYIIVYFDNIKKSF